MGQHDYQIALAQLLQIGGEQQLRIKKGHDVKAEAVELGREIAGNGARQAEAERSDVLGINDAVDRTLEHFIRDRMAQSSSACMWMSRVNVNAGQTVADLA